MLIRNAPKIKSSEITPKSVYMSRRALLGAGAGLALAAALPSRARAGEKLDAVIKGSPFDTSEALTSFKDVTTYNNFYEFGTDKADPAQNAHTLTTAPWEVVIDGLVDKPGRVALEDLIKPHRLEERIYRLRCVEGWSMVIPWIGVPLKDVLARFSPTSQAKFVAFETLTRPEQMPGQKRRFLEWPYREGLRLDEAMHPLTLLAVGLYGEVLPNQNGAPIRLVVPWKYGFKSIKSIVRISLVDTQPPCTWNMLQPDEYGFYSNVNPTVDHPRWSQAKERRIGATGEGVFGSILTPKQETLMFNGYAEEVAHLYTGMDLVKNF